MLCCVESRPSRHMRWHLGAFLALVLMVCPVLCVHQYVVVSGLNACTVTIAALPYHL